MATGCVRCPLYIVLSYCCGLSLMLKLFIWQRWNPISPQQCHGSSIVEVYRIIEEVYIILHVLLYSFFWHYWKMLTIWWLSPSLHYFQTADQFFNLKVPMRPGELSALVRGLDNAFQVYTNHVLDKFGENNFFCL